LRNTGLEDEEIRLHSHISALKTRIGPRIVLDIVAEVPVTTAEIQTDPII
jgi:hypothetical protein